MRDADVAPAPAGVTLAWASLAAIPVAAAVMVQQGLYRQVPITFFELVIGMAGSLALAAVCAKKAPGILVLVTGAIATLFVYYCGPANAIAFGLLGLCALAIGSVFDPALGWPGGLRVLAGLATMAALVGWLLPFPLHDGRAYLLVALALCWWRRGQLLREAQSLSERWRCLAEEAPGWVLLVVGAACVAGLGLWLPSLNYDDNSAHLILPYQLLSDGYYHLDVSTQVWAVAPWTNNVLHGIAALFAGEEARAAVNLVWLLLGLNGAWCLAAALGAPARTRLAAAAVYASLPLTGYFTTAMQVDGASAAVLLHLAAVLVSAGRSLPSAPAIVVLFALLAGLKVTNAIYALPAVAWLCWLALTQRRFRWLVVVASLTIALAGASFFYATWVTGNPVFPLFNSVFKSPYYPLLDFVDHRWQTGLSWRFFWDATVHTDRFGEVYPGAWGFALLALIPAIALGALRDSRIRWVAIWVLVSGLVLFAQVQYLRYVYPAMALLVVVGVVGLGANVQPRLFAIASALLVGGNLLLLPTTSWMVRDNPWHELLGSGTSAGARIEARMAPARVLVERVTAADPAACILIADPESPYIAVAAGRAQSIKNSYDPRMSNAFDWARSDASGARWPAFLSSTSPSHILTGRGTDQGFVGALAGAGYVVDDREGGLAAWIPVDAPARRCSGNLERVRDEAHRRLHPGDRH